MNISLQTELPGPKFLQSPHTEYSFVYGSRENNYAHKDAHSYVKSQLKLTIHF